MASARVGTLSCVCHHLFVLACCGRDRTWRFANVESSVLKPTKVDGQEQQHLWKVYQCRSQKSEQRHLQNIQISTTPNMQVGEVWLGPKECLMRSDSLKRSSGESVADMDERGQSFAPEGGR